MRKFYIFLLLLTSLLSVPSLSFGQVDFREETIYFLLTSRFFDGDPTNNAPNEWSSYDPSGARPAITDPSDVTWRGDFKGLIQKLDYIQDLGFTAIWITPIVQNRGPLDYHGYHAWDFTKVDPRLESPGATFQDLINAVHARGMKIVLDIVTNHSGRFGIKDVAEIKYNTDPTQPWGKDSAGNPLQPNPNWSYDGITPNPADGKIWSCANVAKLPAPYNQNLAAYNWPSSQSYVDNTDINWYHHSGNGFAQGWDDTENLQNRGLAGDCPDLNTGSTVVRNYLVAAYTTFINMGVDAFRWDTMKHMSREDVLYFYDKFKQANPNLFVFGEVAQLRHELHNVEEINPHYYTWRGAVNGSQASGISVIDFYAQATFHGVFESGESFANVTAAARYDNLYSDPSSLVTWLDNHDFGPNNDWNRRFSGSDQNLAAAMNFMFTWRGIPVVYYGTEKRFQQGVYCDIHDASGIDKSIDETGRKYYGAEFATAPSHKIYQHIKKLNAMRRAVPALQKGTWRWDGNAGSNGVGYVRKSGSSEVAVGLAKDGQATFTFSGLTNGNYRDAVTGNAITVSGGGLSFTVQPGSAGIYVLNGPGMIGVNGAGFFQTGSGTSVPVASISPASGSYSNSVQITLSASVQNAPAKIYYTTNGTNPTIASTLYSAPFSVMATTTVKAIAVDNTGVQSAVVTNSYTIGTVSGGMIVYFQKPTSWSTANIHYWNLSPSGAGSTWPGPTMTNDGNGWYKFTIAGASSASIVFNSNGSSQTADLSRSGTGWYGANGVWSSTDPRGTVNLPPAVNISNAGGTYLVGQSISVTLSATDDNTASPVIYYTLNGTVPTNLSTLYSGAINITSSLTIRAIAYDNLGLSSPVKTSTYVFNPPVNAAPVVVISPVGGTFNIGETAVVTLSATDDVDINPAIRYTINGATPTSSSTLYTGAINVTATTVVKAIAIDSQGLSSTVKTETYTFQTAPTGLTVHFKPTGYTNPKIYFWGVTPVAQTTTWPGVAMTAEADGWFKYTFASATCANMIFSNNGTSQSADLNRCAEGWYTNGTWTNTKPVVATGLTIHFFKPTAWTTAKMHYWNVTPITSGNTIIGSVWPGVQMVNDGNGWWSYTIAGASCANIVFNSGSGTQSGDLTRCGEGWYNTSWSSSASRLGSAMMNDSQSESGYELAVYPNPSNGGLVNVQFVLEQSEKVTLGLYDVSGALVEEMKIPETTQGIHQFQINTSYLKGGLYIMQFKTDQQAIRKQLVIKN